MSPSNLDDSSINRTARIRVDQCNTGIRTEAQAVYLQVGAVAKEITRSASGGNGEYKQDVHMESKHHSEWRDKRRKTPKAKAKTRQTLHVHESVLHKPPTAPPPPASFTIDTISLQTFHHFIDLTAPSFCTNPRYMAQTTVFLPQLLFNNPVTMHAALAFTALHLGRLYESTSSSSSQNWLARASVHRNAATRLIRHPSLNPHAHFMTLSSLSLYTIALSLSSPSSLPENVFSLVTLLHNICSPLKQFLYAAPWLQGLDFGRPGQPGPSVAPSALDSSNGLLAPLHCLYDTFTDLELDREELDDPDNREAYRTAVRGLCVAYLLNQTGHEARSAMFWPALAGKRFIKLLNKRRQRALVVLYYYLVMLGNLSERCWWVSEVGRWVDYVYRSIDEEWRKWLKVVFADSL